MSAPVIGLLGQCPRTARAPGAGNASHEWDGMPEFDQEDKTAPDGWLHGHRGAVPVLLTLTPPTLSLPANSLIGTAVCASATLEVMFFSSCALT
jgi:hypothetical protein